MGRDNDTIQGWDQSSSNDPRKWRSRTEAMRQVLVRGPDDGGIERSRFMANLSESINIDISHDYKMPPSSMNIDAKGIIRRSSSASGQLTPTVMEDELDPLSVSLLPPLHLMSPVQKHGLMQQL